MCLLVGGVLLFLWGEGSICVSLLLFSLLFFFEGGRRYMVVVVVVVVLGVELSQ